MSIAYLDELNPIQRAAVEQTEGPVMIVAGPGSGKTRVLTYRIAHLIRNACAPAYQILALTFTNKAAKEMKARVEKIVGETAARQLWMGTFHSIFARILRTEADKLGYPTNFTVYDQDDAKSLIKTILKEQNLSDENYKPQQVLQRISHAKNNLLTPEAYLQNETLMAADLQAGRPQLGNIYRAYYRRCRQAGAMDFDDLLVKTYILLYKNTDVLEKYRQKFKFLLIDEFQDTNFAQYAIIQLLAQSHHNIAVVGDDAQSIYAFRGATIENILNFERDYGKFALKVFKLEQNYRSTGHIVAVANSIIANNQRQIAKQIWTSNENGGKVRLAYAPSDSAEAKLIADWVLEERLRYHFRNDDIAILYRTNAQSRPIEEALRKQGIPYRIYGGLSFYQRKEIKDMMAYLRLVVNRYDEEALKRVINYPSRGIGDTTMEKMGQLALKNNIRLWEVAKHIDQVSSVQARQKAKIWEFVQLIERFAQLLPQTDAYEMARIIGSESGIVTDLYQDKTVEGLSRYENLQELFNSVKEFTDNKRELAADTLEENDATLGAYLQEVSLLTDLDDENNEQGTVKMMTVHAAKGLEFGCVFIAGMEEGLFPSQRSANNAQEIEEERRLFYVAVTRAEKSLTLSGAQCRYKFGELQYAQPSRFLSEIPPQMLNNATAGTNIPRIAIPAAELDENSSSFMRQNINSIKRQQSPSPNNPSIVTLPSFKPSDPLLIKEGMTVWHQRFGRGKVFLVEGGGDKRMAHIRFEVQGEKRILLKFALLMIVE
ncbi:MAG: UvrD-helicase domain-containing protein [Chitinophagales bacterium]|nr:UvrD-helicase domain-containing protein [Chitinophagales bacterium]